MAKTSDSLTATGSVTLTKPEGHTAVVAAVSGTYGTVTFVFEGTIDSTNYFPLAAYAMGTGAAVSGTVSPSDNSELAYLVPAPGCSKVRLRVTAIASGTVTVNLDSHAFVSLPYVSNYTNAGTFSGVTLAGTTTVSGKLDVTDVGTVAAAGSAQGDAAALTNAVTYVTAADGTKGVVLPAAAAGTLRLVYNTHATNGLKVYPASGDDVNDGTGDAAVTIEGKTLAIFLALDASTWAAIYTANS